MTSFIDNTLRSIILSCIFLIKQRHRVVIPENAVARTKGRHSIAYFVHPDNLTPIVPIDTCAASSSSTEEIDGNKPATRKKSFKAARMK